MHLTAVEFRQRYDGEGMLQHFRSELITPHLDALRDLRPLHQTWGAVYAREAANRRMADLLH
jgi:hypothetical protein